MGRRTRSKKSDTNVVGKGKVTPAQVAFIVDCYLANNNFSETHSLFRSEASSLLPKRLLQEVPEKLLRLEEILDEYICLKEQKVTVDQTMYHLDLEKTRLQTLLQGKQNLLNAYNASASPSCTTPPLLPSSNCSLVPSMVSNSVDLSPAGFTAIDTPLRTLEFVPNHSNTLEPDMFLTPILNPQPPRKRKSCESVTNISETTKKSCGLTSDNQSTSPGQPQDYVASTQDAIKGYSTSPSVIPEGSPVQGSTIAKNLFNSSSESPNSNSSGLHTPKRSTSFHSDKSMMYSAVKPNFTSTSVETTPTNCTIIASKTIIFNSPTKHYSIDRRHCAFSSPSKRDQVKGRLDFDDTTDLPVIPKNASPDLCTTSGSDKDGDLFDLDFEPLAPDFSISELLHDFGLGCEVDGSLSQHNETDIRVNQEQDSTTKDPDSITSVRSIAQCVQISSPAKKATSSNQQTRSGIPREAN